MAYYLGVSGSPSSQDNLGYVPSSTSSQSGVGANPTVTTTTPAQAPYTGTTQTLNDINSPTLNTIENNRGYGGFGSLSGGLYDRQALNRYNGLEKQYGTNFTPWALTDAAKPFANQLGGANAFNLLAPSGTPGSSLHENQRDYMGGGLFGNHTIDYNAFNGSKTTNPLSQTPYYNPVAPLRAADSYRNPYSADQYGNFFSDSYINGILNNAGSQFVNGYYQNPSINNAPSTDQYRTDFIKALMPTYYTGANFGPDRSVNNDFNNWWAAAAPYLGGDQLSAYQKLATSNQLPDGVAGDAGFKLNPQPIRMPPPPKVIAPHL